MFYSFALLVDIIRLDVTGSYARKLVETNIETLTPEKNYQNFHETILKGIISNGNHCIVITN